MVSVSLGLCARVRNGDSQSHVADNRYVRQIVENADNITQTLSLLVAENAVALLPALVERFQVPGVTFRPLRGSAAKWDLQVAWQRGRITEPVRELVNLLTKR